MNKESAYKKIAELVERFEEQYASYKNANYNETLTRRDFIDPFFKALGWDIDNEQGHAEAYREVIHEDKIKVGTATKAPDYSFRLGGGKRLFFVEAKKPSVVVKDDIQPAYQVRRYGWSAKLPISIITDFEEFAVYDCSKKPNPSDKASVARIRYLTFREYLKEFDFLWTTFSKEYVLKGSFDSFVKSAAHKKGTATVDAEFLLSLDRWRTLLAEKVAKQNKELDEDEINFAVQQFIDRIIFLRIAEDRSVEPYGTLKTAITGENYYENLFDIFRAADKKYNSGLFDFKKDQISANLVVDNKTIKAIVNELYYPESPYEFSVLSVEILGNAYEQFLGKQIKIDKNHRAKIEEKPEVRKAGGVYYTPQYIVEYIVANTVGKLVEGKTPEAVAELKIVDPACGSGSFLLGAYQFLLDWHKDYYTKNAKKNKKDSPLTPDGTLTTAEKKRILLNNIYGVDIDANAVEVTKLSLLLKCMEGETQASISHQMALFKERVLPTLDDNIKSGNSLIDLDFYDNQLDFGEEKKVKPFSWQKEFPQIFEQGGFDVVIGNPPYVNIRTITETVSQTVKDYFNKTYVSAFKGYDLYVLFIEQGLKLLKDHGLISYIVPNKFASLDYGLNIRRIMLSKTKVEELLDVSHLKVFGNVGVYPYVFRIRNAKAPSDHRIQVLKCDSINDLNGTPRLEVTQSDFLKQTNLNISLNLGESEHRTVCRTLNQVCHVQAGTTGFLATKTKDCIVEGGSKGLDFIVTGSIDRYSIALGNVRYINKLFSMPKLINKNNVISDGKWNLFCSKKIVIGGMTKTIEAAYDPNGVAVGVSVYCLTDFTINPMYLLGILNSKYVTYFFRNRFEAKHLAGGYLAINVGQLEQIPIPEIDFKDPIHVDRHQRIIALVEQLTDAYKNLTTLTIDSQKNTLMGRILYLESSLDTIVYELYGLTPDEIKLVESFNT